MKKRGVILLCHGSRLPETRRTLERLQEMIGEGKGFAAVKGAFLQFGQPDLPAALAQMSQLGLEQVVVVPLFLVDGVHVKKDIPEILNRERARYPQMEIIMAGHIGAHRKLAEIILERIQEVVS
ncbi:sirohydrochlorin chelatase [Desulfovirgula thermocuniculi]|uniref:sirohydrochlorin chelatase n=1 Tax=Desulfovirgula thermocuniculi TaxID=348842 RepID=UPI0003F62EDA|nr:CbiX/SirB N-terminal domain-containing protein [Desulfovirgula thermocuniculi]